MAVLSVPESLLGIGSLYTVNRVRAGYRRLASNSCVQRDLRVNVKTTDTITACAEDTGLGVHVDLCGAACLNGTVLKDASQQSFFDQALRVALMATEASAYGRHYLKEDKLLLHKDAGVDCADKQEMDGGLSVMIEIPKKKKKKEVILLFSSSNLTSAPILQNPDVF